MRTEKDKMLSGELYTPSDVELINERTRTRLLLQELNDCKEDNYDERINLLKKLFPNAGDNLSLQTPFYCDYGTNLYIGNDVFLNFNCIILDVMKVQIGDRTKIGPNVQIYTATHPIDYQERASGVEFAKPISIGNDVWLGGSVVICPGVSIGDRSVIGAGSVVTKNIPSDVIAVGNPCRIIKKI